MLRQGVDEFNRRQFFEQHESLETLWRAEPAPVRYLYQGILQVGVGFFHLYRGNYHGAVVKLASGLALLQPFEPACLGIDVAGLRRQCDLCLRAVLSLGPAELDRFDLSLIPLIRLQ